MGRAPVFCNFVDHHVRREKEADVTELLCCKVNYGFKHLMCAHKSPIEKCVYKTAREALENCCQRKKTEKAHTWVGPQRARTVAVGIEPTTIPEICDSLKIMHYF